MEIIGLKDATHFVSDFQLHAMQLSSLTVLLLLLVDCQ